mgnify:CR=1 FL=1
MNSIVELILQIKSRPAMYIGCNSISCLKAFIDGWFLRAPESVIDSNVMDEFQRWIERKYNIDTAHSWKDIILFYSQDEGDALLKFFDEFEEWKNDV